MRTKLILAGFAVTLGVGLGTGCVRDMSGVSDAAKHTIDEQYPGATVQSVEGKLGNIYEIELAKENEETELEIHKDGTIIEVETEVDRAELPQAVADAAAKKAGSNELMDIERIEKRAKCTLGGVERLDTPVVYYEVHWKCCGLKWEGKFNADGTAY
jgi:hypothetical protein